MTNCAVKTFLVLILALLWVVLCQSLSPAATAHRFHTSLTRVDYNSEAKTIEITIQTFSHDLEATLERQTGKRVNLDKTPEIDRILLKYLNERFVIKNQKGETKPLRMVGKEQETDAVWLYVETPLPEGIEGATLENRLLFEMFNDQVNLVSARYGNQKNDLVFRLNDKAQTLMKKE